MATKPGLPIGEGIDAQQCLDIAGVMFVALDSAGTVTLANRKACDVLEYPQEEILGRNWFEHFIPAEERVTIREVFRRLVAGDDLGPGERYENRVLTRSGATRMIMWRNTIIRDDIGNIIGTLSSGTDVTDQRQAEGDRSRLLGEAVSAAQDARDRLWRRVEHLCSAAIGITAEHDLTHVLQEVADSAREVIGARYAALGVLDPTGKALVTFVVSGLSSEEYRRIGEPPHGKGILGVLIDTPRPLRLKDLRAHPQSYGFPPNHPAMHSFLGVPIFGRAKPIGNLYLTEKLGAEEFSREDEALAVMLAAHAAVAVENARLYEEREKLLDELRALQVSRDRFFAMINHELRNALTAVHGWTELWLRKAGAGAPRAAREVAESAERAVTLLEDMLDLSRLDASKLAPRVQDADVIQVVREAVGAMEPAAVRRRVSIETTGTNRSVSCRSDPLRIRQILINLLSNAVRHSPEGDTVTVDVQATSELMRFDVVDRGEGIPAEVQARIFEAFERAGKDSERGTGLGLTLSKKLAEVLGGDLTVTSRPGAGARFSLQVPRYLSPL